MIEGYGGITSNLFNMHEDTYQHEREEMSFHKNIDRVEFADQARRKRFKIGVQGVAPNYPQAVESQNVRITKAAHGLNSHRDENWLWDLGGHDIGEFLYSARGAQSAGISEYFMNKYALDPNDLDSTFLYDVYSEKWGNKYYEVRPGFGVSVFGGLMVKDVMLASEHDTLVSIPLFCKMGGISLNELEYETVHFKVKWYWNHILYIRDKFFGDYQNATSSFSGLFPSEDLTYDNPPNYRSWKANDEEYFFEKNRDINLIFGAIVVISMALCFFSLSSSMTANIYD